MLRQPTLDTLRSLKLPGMAQACEYQQEQPHLQQLSFDERFALIVEGERAHREAQRLKRLLRNAHFRQPASMEDLDFRANRGLDKSLLATLSTCDWIRQAQCVLLTGPSGVGKSWIAQALGLAACRQGMRVQYERAHRLLETLRLARSEGTYHKRLAQLARLDLLILDDFGLQTLQAQERHDLLEVIEDRYQLHGTIITSQLPPAAWHAYLEEPTVADALLDRLFHRSYRIELGGTSLRRKESDLTKVKG